MIYLVKSTIRRIIRQYMVINQDYNIKKCFKLLNKIKVIGEI